MWENSPIAVIIAIGLAQTGIALIRMIQRRDDDLAMIQASQQSTSCGHAQA